MVHGRESVDQPGTDSHPGDLKLPFVQGPEFLDCMLSCNLELIGQMANSQWKIPLFCAIIDPIEVKKAITRNHTFL